jgi:membrane protease subunit HflK
MADWPPRNRFPGERFPDLGEQLDPLRRLAARWGTRRIVGVLLGGVALLWLLSGLYVVGPGERGVVLLWGRVVGQTEPGLRYRLPKPIQDHVVVDIASVRRAEVGFRADRGAVRGIPSESLMLTGDENIVEAHLIVQYLVQDPVRFQFGARHPERALHASAEVALRAAVGQTTIDYTMTEGRVEVQDRVKAQLQELLDRYNTGLLATEVRLLVVDPPREVQEAFHDVVRAWEDRERLIKEAEGYRESIIPRARGEAVQMIQAAEAYREQRMIRARGDADRFLRVLDEYRKAEAVTRDRLYLEMVDRVLPRTQKVVLDPAVGGRNVVPLLPLKEFFATGGAAPAGAANEAARPAEPAAPAAGR